MKNLEENKSRNFDNNFWIIETRGANKLRKNLYRRFDIINCVKFDFFLIYFKYGLMN